MSQAANLSPDESRSVIYSALLDNGIPDPLAKLVTAQAGHETGDFISHAYITLNNAFGYGWNGSTYFSYASVEDSVSLGIVPYLNEKAAQGEFPPLDQITSPDQYAQLLKSAGYYTDAESNYAAGIKRYFQDNIALVGGSLAVLALILAGAWYLSK